MKYQCSRKRFLEDIKKHELHIIQDEGVNRHIILKRPDSNNYRFDIRTWPGYLCVTGDVGSWIFSRIEDMFEFFIMRDTDFNKEHIINPQYWAEKIQACPEKGFKEFSEDLLKENIKDHFRSHQWDSEDLKGETWAEIEEEIIYYMDDGYTPDELYRKIHDFEHKGFIFEEFWYDNTVFTSHYIWICYAIVWAIMKYNEAKVTSDKI